MKNKDNIIKIGNLEHTFNLLGNTQKAHKAKNNVIVSTKQPLTGSSKYKNNEKNNDIPLWLVELMSSGSSNNSSSSNNNSNSSSCNSSCSS